MEENDAIHSSPYIANALFEIIYNGKNSVNQRHGKVAAKR